MTRLHQFPLPVRAGAPRVPSASVSTLDIGLLPIDVGKYLRHLRRDLLDDWYPDPLEYSDVLDTNVLTKEITRIQGAGKGLYFPGTTVVRNVPKTGGALRYSVELNILDRFVYQVLVGELAHALDPLLSPRVFSHRLPACATAQSKRFFKSGVAQWKLYQDAVRHDAASSWLVECDLQNFYESISVATLHEELGSALQDASGTPREQATRQYVYAMLFSMLPHWCYKRTHGLPQNRDASSFLANQLMRSVDTAMANGGWDYYRYMDDIRIKCKSRHDARKSLVQLTEHLRRVGLSLNARKTFIREPGTTEHAALVLPDDRRLQDIDHMWWSRSPKLLSKSLQYISQLIFELLSESPSADSRAFRFCVGRVERLSRCADFTSVLPGIDQLKERIIARLSDDAHCCDQLCRLLKAVPLSPSELRGIELLLLSKDSYLYEWQRFHIASLLLSHGHCSAEMLAAARNALPQPDGLLPEDIAIVLLGHRGTEDDRKRIAKSFDKDWCHVKQRAAIIALHDLDYVRHLQSALDGKVGIHLMGQLRRLAEVRKGVYFAQPRQLSYGELFDLEPAYV